jgi:8-oxo-dGTP pyrophosphatase MutT (NUDIX family)
MDRTATELLLHCLSAYARPQSSESWIVAPEASPVSLDVPGDYRRALDDLLGALGVLAGPDRALASPTAYYFLQSLIHGIREGAFTRLWLENGQSGEPAGSDWLGLMETQRLLNVPDAAPMRSVRAVMGVIKTVRDGRALYLMQYDRGAEQYQPIGGKVEADDADNVAALARELSEELRLPPLVAGKDFVALPLKERARYRTISATLNVLTEYEHSFYHLRDLRFAPSLDDDTTWLDAEEMAAGRANDGRAVSRLMLDNLAALLPSLGDSFGGRAV